MFGFLKHITLYLRPPKNKDVFFADPLDFAIERHSEMMFYPTMDRHGHSLFNVSHGNNTYRFTIYSDHMPYYVFDVEILVADRENPYKKTWLKRSQQKRIFKKDFIRLVKQGRMIKTEDNSTSIFH